MSCQGCSSASQPAGCRSNGTCGTSGCNKLNVYNWLADIPLSDLGTPFQIIEVFFKRGSRKDFFKNGTHHVFEKGDWVTVESSNGYDVGQISLTGELVKLQLKKHGVKEDADFKKILRYSTERDLENYELAKSREKEILVRARAIARSHQLEMKVSDVEIQADGKKVTVFYTADSRVDFRELIKAYASDFKSKIEMKQIGARQESAIIGGIGSCGRELCCSTWLTDFKSVNTTAARYQNLSINQAKLSGQCGRLKCCLNFELDTYMDALKAFPVHAEHLQLAAGKAFLQKKDIFKNLMWYSFAGSTKQYPLTIERVKEILKLNKEGVFPEELEAVEIQVRVKQKSEPVDFGFINDVGQLSLNSLSKNKQKKKKKSKPGHEQRSRTDRKAAGKQEAKATTPGKRPEKPSEPGTSERRSHRQRKERRQPPKTE